MKTYVLLLLIGVLVLSIIPASQAQIGTAFTYQGRLNDGGTLADGQYDFAFELYSTAAGVGLIATTPVFEDINVYDGRFTLILDFGVSAFPGAARWLQIGIRPGATTDPFTPLSPRQELTPSPYALFAEKSDWLNLLNLPPDFADGVDNNTTYSTGQGLVLTGTTISHADTSSQASINNSSGTVIQDVSLDTNGHVTSLKSYNLDSRYYTESQLATGGGGGQVHWNNLTSVPAGFNDNIDNVDDADWIISGSNMYSGVAGTVGVGTSTPSAKLDVAGTAEINGNLNMMTYDVDNVSYYDVRPGEGYGIRFWSSNNYAINMGNSSEFKYGPVNDYSMKFNCGTTAGRGWTWGGGGQTPVAALSTDGDMQISGNSYALGYFATGTQSPSATYQVQAVTGTKTPYAGFFETNDNSGLAYGLVGRAVGAGGTTHYGVYGYANGAATNWAGYFSGDLYASGNVGIGTVFPGKKLHIYRSVGSTYVLAESNDSYAFFRADGSNNTGFQMYQDGAPKATLWWNTISSYLSLGVHSGVSLIIKGNNIGIGTSYPSHILHVDGLARSTSSTWATSSDRRVKKNINNLENSLDKLNKLRPVSFEYTDQYKQDNQDLNGTHFGFIAQEVKEVIPEMVSQTTEHIDDEILEDFHLLDSGKLIPMLVQAVKEQQQQIESLQQQVNTLQTQLQIQN
ncbi:MAG: tail fiber domain-containing protein [Planctomycetes bacterium]|nr:tail fiber domain-containing protein [Planctomycetota bacterium]